MDRNIVTQEDVLRDSIASARDRGAGEAGNGAPRRTADDYWARLTKYVPVEIISAYLLIVGLIPSDDSGGPLRSWLLAASLLAGVVGTWFFAKRVLGVIRPLQAAMSCLGFVVWALATGGWFALQAWYEPWLGTAAVIVFGVVIQIVKVPPLPDNS